MKPILDHIRKTFSGDERFMMTQASYRVEHYTPGRSFAPENPDLWDRSDFPHSSIQQCFWACYLLDYESVFL